MESLHASQLLCDSESDNGFVPLGDYGGCATDFETSCMMVVLVIVAMITMMVVMVAMAVVTWMLHEEHLLAATQPLLGRNREKRV